MTWCSISDYPRFRMGTPTFYRRFKRCRRLHTAGNRFESSVTTQVMEQVAAERHDWRRKMVGGKEIFGYAGILTFLGKPTDRRDSKRPIQIKIFILILTEGIYTQFWT